MDLDTVGWLVATLKAHPRVAAVLIGLWLAATLVNAVVGVWKKRTEPEKLALLSANRVGRGLLKLCSSLGWHPTKTVDAIADFIAGALNAWARARGVPIPYPPEARAILTSPVGDPPRVVVVLPEQHTSVPAVIPAGMLEAARRESEAERAAAKNTQEKP